MNLIFAGTPEFAVPSLKILIETGHTLRAVFTQPDRPAGRGRKLTASPIKIAAEHHGIALYQPENLKDDSWLDVIKNTQADAIIVAAYGMILPQSWLELPRFGCINIHPSLLPIWRGATPIQSAILNGDSTTGVSIMRLELAMDSGPILLQEEMPLDSNINSGDLHNLLAQRAAVCLLKTLDALVNNSLSATPQTHSLATYCKKIIKADGLINWSNDAVKIHNQIRGLNPWPIASTTLFNQTLRLGSSTIIAEDSTHSPGTIIAFSAQGLDVAAGKHILRLNSMQLPGGKMLNCHDFYNAKRNIIKPEGMKLGG